MTMGSLGLPLLSGFVGEFLVMLGAFRARLAGGHASPRVVIFAAWYLLWMFQRVMFQPPKASSAGFRDLNRLELVGPGAAGRAEHFHGRLPGVFLGFRRGRATRAAAEVAVSMRRRPTLSLS